MKRLCFTFLMLVFGLLAYAQNISVKEFYCAENDLTARTHGTSVEDQNGYLCALIKVRTTEKGLWTFDVGMLGVTKIEMQNAAHAAEIWVYVPFGVMWISIQHERFGLLDRWRFPCDIAKGCTYVMALETTSGHVPPMPESGQQYLAFQILPANALLEVNDNLWALDASGTAMKQVELGAYTYRVNADGYYSDAGKITVDVSDKPIIVPITLSPISSDLVSSVAPIKKRIISENEEVFIVNGVRFTMKLVEGGTFQMGSSEKKADKDQKPVHDVTLSDYYMGETEVTQALWKAVMGNNPSNREGDYWPVESVSWNDCQEFVRKLNQLTNTDWVFRLPTEAEWEYAARGGQKNSGKIYAGSDYIVDVAWRGFSSTSYYDHTTNAVKGKQPNELGLYDMSGNVWEWCQDWYGEYKDDSVTNPIGPLDGIRRVFRGGSNYSAFKNCRVSYRESNDPGKRFIDVGFRLCLSK